MPLLIVAAKNILVRLPLVPEEPPPRLTMSVKTALVMR